jgi:hypothetical protein
MVAIVAVIKYFLLLNDVIIFGADLDGIEELKMAKLIPFWWPTVDNWVASIG